MKKVLFGILLLLVILGGIFYQQILSTIDFYRYQNDHADIFAKATLTWKTLPFTSAGSNGRVSDTLSFGSLQLPVPYGATKSIGADAAMAVGYTELITISRSSAADSFFRMYNFTPEEETATCDFLSKTSGRGACTSNYDFYRAFLELNQTDIHVFTSIQNKELYNRLIELRAGDTLPSQTVSGFETSNLRGFLFTVDNNNYVAEVFDTADQQYKLRFEGLSQADVAFVLSNTTVQTTASN